MHTTEFHSLTDSVILVLELKSKYAEEEKREDPEDKEEKKGRS